MPLLEGSTNPFYKVIGHSVVAYCHWLLGDCTLKGKVKSAMVFSSVESATLSAMVPYS